MTPETENKEQPVVGQDDFRQLLRAKMVAAVRLTLIEILSRWTRVLSHCVELGVSCILRRPSPMAHFKLAAHAREQLQQI
ncbi:MAG: hypothetical protein ACT4QE_03785, partial [Anaerolineales bacterium]